ncbi:response regulator [Opitutus terrae]|uniref:Two component transcriptional regulator, LuxR family n=1 Tax=Opitutus terrae (strain DSM 11246 / JCM 15787 / PB90-1) TaxID=452637 RepID=B1ZP37_OPITP|nr:response regulator transcription factor [Opitutus terrae]ACB77523.1 two component transcriptional regulator, LuxR family [Opitutus terrae PB90-1]
MTSALTVLVIDDHPATREGLRAAIDAQRDLRVVGEAATWQEARRLAAELRPDVMVLDLNLPDGNGWTLVEQLKAADALPPTLVLSVCDEQLYARRLLRAGAGGYLMKDEPMETILRAIREVREGRIIASATITNSLLSEALGMREDEPPAEAHDGNLAELSDRELQIFALLGRGLRNKEIAARLRLSEKTVATYKVRLMSKLGVRTTPALIEHYRRWNTAGENGAASRAVEPGLKPESDAESAAPR